MLNQHEATPTVPANALVWIGRWLLLIPEAFLLLLLLLLYVSTGQPLPIALLVAGVVGVFSIRSVALHLARAAIEQARYIEADALAQVAHLLYPFSADTHALRGVLAVLAGDPERGETLLRRAETLLPGQPSVEAALSGALLEQGQASAAVAAARQALDANPRYAMAYLYLADASRQLGASAHTLEQHLRDGMELAKRPDEQAALQCALVGHLLSEQRVAEASLQIHSIEALLSQCHTSRQAEIRYYLGAFLSANGQNEQARAFFQDVEALDPQGRYTPAAWRAARMS